MMSRSPALATVLLVFFLVAVPVVFINRFSQGLLPLQPIDVALAIGLAAWLVVSKAVLDRDEHYDTSRHQRLSPRWQAAQLVEQSVLGVGFLASRAADGAIHAASTLSRVVEPEAIGPEMLAPAVSDDLDRAHRSWATEREVRATPILAATEVVAPPVIATEEYEVQRGDTWWSVAAWSFGDGRLWKPLLELNLGREVAPGVVVEHTGELRIGWTVLVPLGSRQSSDEEAAEQHHE